MGQLLSDLLSNRDFREPPEIKEIKEFVQAEIGLTPKVSIKTSSYVVQVPSAAAAGALRSSLFKLQQQIGNDKRLLIRIG